MSYISLSSGAPGSILFSMPSRPAISIAENARYGLQDASGNLTSTLLAFGLAEYIGILTDALLFLLEYARFTGASKPGTNLQCNKGPSCSSLHTHCRRIMVCCPSRGSDGNACRTRCLQR